MQVHVVHLMTGKDLVYCHMSLIFYYNLGAFNSISLKILHVCDDIFIPQGKQKSYNQKYIWRIRAERKYY